jgi:hypothetical protein
MTRKIALGVVAILIAFAVLLSASIALILATLRIDHIAGPAARAAAAGAELILGTAMLLAVVYIATRAAVVVFATPDVPAAPVNGTALTPNAPANPSSASQAIG